MNSPEIKEFIRENASLFWDIREDKKEHISLEVLVETVLNYGDIQTVKRLFELVEIQKVAEVFHSRSERRKNNYLLYINGSSFSEKLFRQQVCFFVDIDYSEELEYMGSPISHQKIQEFLIEVATSPF